MARFSNKVVIITGSSSGIGRSTAVLFAKAGAKVTITGRNSEKLRETVEEILKSGGKTEDIHIVVGDLTESECQTDLVKSTLGRFGKIDILVNNAGAAFADPSGKIGIQSEINLFDDMLKLNLRSVVELVQKCRPHLIASKGDIVNVSSICAGPQPFVYYTYYGIAKAGLDQLTRCMAMELIEHGVRVNSVSPGLISTGFLTAVGMPSDAVKKTEDYYASHRDCIPAGRPGKPEEIATLIAFLADKNSSAFIIGQSIIIDGGTSLALAMPSSSNGIGRATAVILAQEGAKITITGRNAQRLEETRLEILKSGIPENHVLAVSTDLTTEKGQDELVNFTIQKFGRINILVNNAGAAFNDDQGHTGVDQDVSAFERAMEINLRSVVTLTKKAKEHLIKVKGEIINVSSIGAGPQAHPDLMYYGMSKAALNQFTKSAAIDLIKHGVRVNAVSPGWVSTGILEAMGMPEEASYKIMNFMGSHKECIPYGAAGQPVDIANIIAFLADRKLSSYIIGQSIVADGGSTLVMGMQTRNMMDILKSA